MMNDSDYGLLKTWISPDVNHQFIELTILSISLVLNTTIFVVILSTKRLHTFQNVFIASLAASDLIFAITCNIFAGIVVYSELLDDCDYEPPIKLLCVYFFASSFSMVSSRCFHLIISIERWMYIAWPFVHQRLVTCKSATWCLVLLWIVSLLTGVHVIIECTVTEFLVGFGTVDSSVHFAVGIIMLVIYVHIATIIRRQSMAVCQSRTIGTANPVYTTNGGVSWNIIRLPITVLGSFFLLVTPIVCINIYSLVIIDRTRHLLDYKIREACKLASYLHTWSNFFVYVLQDKEFRSVLNAYVTKVNRVYRSRKIHHHDSSN
ncbi:hypothetical protein BsWGS_11402 [Bradybaena similaris]